MTPLKSRITVSASDQGITRVGLRPSKRKTKTSQQKRAQRWMTLVSRELQEYFEGRRSFFDVPCDLSHLTPFELKVLEATSRIPYGEVRTYRWVAEQVGKPTAARAVGNALHRNPIPFIIPCHRVIRSDGSLGGYGFGIERKRRLLKLERQTAAFVGCETTRIVCRRGCQKEQRTDEVHKIPFPSAREALQKGFRACRICRPANPSAAFCLYSLQ